MAVTHLIPVVFALPCGCRLWCQVWRSCKKLCDVAHYWEELAFIVSASVAICLTAESQGAFRRDSAHQRLCRVQTAPEGLYDSSDTGFLLFMSFSLFYATCVQLHAPASFGNAVIMTSVCFCARAVKHRQQGPAVTTESAHRPWRER